MPAAPDDTDVTVSAANAGDQDAMYICVQEDCGNNSVHEHGGVMYKGWRGKISMPAPVLCTREDCDVSGPHWHENGEVIHYYNTLPAYIECGFEGCTIQGTHYHYDPQVADSAADVGEPIGCPPEAIDQDFYQKYPEADYQNFEHHESDHQDSEDSHH